MLHESFVRFFPDFLCALVSNHFSYRFHHGLFSRFPLIVLLAFHFSFSMLLVLSFSFLLFLHLNSHFYKFLCERTLDPVGEIARKDK